MESSMHVGNVIVTSCYQLIKQMLFR